MVFTDVVVLHFFFFFLVKKKKGNSNMNTLPPSVFIFIYVFIQRPTHITQYTILLTK